MTDELLDPISPACESARRTMLLLAESEIRGDAARGSRTIGSVEESILESLEEHVRGCGACQAILEGREPRHAMVEQLLARDAVRLPSAEEWRRIERTLAHAPRVEVVRRPRARRAAWAALAALVLVVVTLASLPDAKRPPAEVALEVDIVEAPADSMTIVLGRAAPEEAVLIWFASS